MAVCMFAFMCDCTCAYGSLYVYLYGCEWLCVPVFVGVHMAACLYASKCVYGCVYAYLYVCVWSHVCVRVCVSIEACMC